MQLNFCFEGADVTVVIPTIGRLTLFDSIRSVTIQDEPVAQILVINDSPNSIITDLSSFSNVRLIENTGNIGGNSARKIGVDHCNTDLLMFLDDDDIWERDKVSSQLHEINTTLKSVSKIDKSWVSFTKVRIMKSNGVKTNKVVPHGQFSNSAGFERFLTERHSIFHGIGIIPFSSMCIPKKLLQEHPLDLDLAFHQDLTWLITLSRKISLFGISVDKPTVHFRQGLNRISSTPDFESVTTWCEKYLLPFSKVSAGDYILSFGFQVMRSKSNSSCLDLFKVLRWAYKHTKPSSYSYLYALAWIVLVFFRLDKKLDRRGNLH